LLVFGCADRKGSDKDRKDFLKQISFLDKESLQVIEHNVDERGVHVLVVKSARVDFEAIRAIETTKGIPSESSIAYIEKITSYRYKLPGQEMISCRTKVRNYGDMTFNFTRDGDDYIVDCMFEVGKVEITTPPTVPTKAK